MPADGCGSSVWNIPRCILGGQTETDAVRYFSRTAMLTHISLRPGSDGPPHGLKRLVHQRLSFRLGQSNISSRILILCVCVYMCVCVCVQPASASTPSQFLHPQHHPSRPLPVGDVIADVRVAKRRWREDGSVHHGAAGLCRLPHPGHRLYARHLCAGDSSAVVVTTAMTVKFFIIVVVTASSVIHILIIAMFSTAPLRWWRA